MVYQDLSFKFNIKVLINFISVNSLNTTVTLIIFQFCLIVLLFLEKIRSLLESPLAIIKPLEQQQTELTKISTNINRLNQ